MVNINIEIPDELHRALKLAATLEGKTLKAYVIATLHKHIKRQPALGGKQ